MGYLNFIQENLFYKYQNFETSNKIEKFIKKSNMIIFILT